MAYSIDSATGDLVVQGFNAGIGSSPYTGITDMRSVDPVSVPGEVSVSLATQSVTLAPNVGSQSVTVTSNTFPIAASLLLETYQAVTITSAGTSGLTLNGTYWLVYVSNSGSNNLYGFSPTYGSLSVVTITGPSSVTFSSLNPTTPKYFSKGVSYNFMVDSAGLVWSDKVVTAGGGSVPITHSWTYTGNPTDATSNGNGLLVYRTIHGGTGSIGTPATFDEFLFVWRNGQIDYTQILSNSSNTSISWVVGWNPALTSGTTTGQTAYLQNSYLIKNSHMAIQTLPNLAVYCDSFFVSVFFQNIPALSSSVYTGFDPTTPSTYYFNTFNLLPPTDTAQCLSFLNQYVLVGGSQNYIYPWNAAALDKEYTAPVIILPESNIVNIVNVGNNGYIFAGNRGNIYITNGSQASLFQKMPDHLSGTIEPYFYWGGATYNKNRLYFGVYASGPNGGASLNYGGLWCIDLTTQALFNSNKFSSAVANVYASALATFTYSPTYSANPNAYLGYGLLMGWSDGGSVNNGIDESIGTPYAGGQSFIVSDLIPVGTALKPMTAYQVEFKLACPLALNETVQLLMASSLYDYQNNNFTSLGTTSGTAPAYTTSDGTNPQILSANFPITVQKQQWIILKAILTSTAPSPSYNRVVQLRVIGDTVKTQVANQPFATQ